MKFLEQAELAKQAKYVKISKQLFADSFSQRILKYKKGSGTSFQATFFGEFSESFLLLYYIN